ncbi:MAG: ATP-dependent Clp protease ATP-binding subunit [Oscillospiraceae bacterium]|nr:ATP-dependent Clp protease ATP-binding subunit [Oscillospiraceae bacterium]MDD7470763.1 ATP-dependent Clp protease ATP-binding subunit [Oscillospiraceae bacterium]
MDNKLICSRCKKRPAVIFVSRIDGDKTTQEGFCLKCAMELNIGPVKQMMQNMGITEEDLDSVSEQFDEMLGGLEGFQPGGAGTLPFMQNFMNGSAQNGKNDAEDEESAQEDDAEEENGEQGKKKKKKKRTKRKFLNLYCTDLTEKARDGKIDRIVGRETEIYRVMQILCRRTKNNPCLIGEPGVGKTAIAEGLALKIASGEVPAKIADKEIHLLDLTALVAGTQFRGQFESRIKGLIDEVKAEGNIILFIDEVHNLVGTGDAEGSMNAANILKPALSRGEIQVVGATTFNEYRKHIEKDAALERRFQPVKVEEPSVSDCYNMLIGIKGYYEDYHKVSISDSLVYKTVVLSERYINDRFLPDKAIDLLDEACTCANLRNVAISDYEKLQKRLSELDAEEDETVNITEGEIDYEKLANIKQERMKLKASEEELKEKAADNAVTEGDIANVINLWTGIPTSKIIENDMKKLSDLESKLKARIIGQDEAIEALCAAVRRSRVQISPVRRPASFIFVGPTGVGKTELVKQLANELFETPETLIRLDMSEFMEKHSVSRIIGAPPGYVGYDEAGQLTEKVRRKPYSVILFDEIEKAHPDVLNILLQILDEGKTSDAQGRTVSFENTVIVMTSNAGSELKETALGFNRDVATASKEKAMKALKEFLRPEFIGRVDEVILFNSLTKEDLVKISDILINELRGPLQDKGIGLEVGNGVSEIIAEASNGGGRGARDIRRTIRKQIEDKITDILIDRAEEPVSIIEVTAVDGEIKVSYRT